MVLMSSIFSRSKADSFIYKRVRRLFTGINLFKSWISVLSGSLFIAVKTATDVFAVLFALIHFVSVLSTLLTFLWKKVSKNHWDSVKHAIIIMSYIIICHVHSVPNPALPYIGFIQAVFYVITKH
jgi:hypothetical protein